MGIEERRDRPGVARNEEEARWSEWMVRANAGDAEAYTKLLGEIGVAMERYLRRHFGESDFIEDCVQECLLSIHRARATYDPTRRLRPWMFTIVRHKAIDMLRRRGSRDRHEVPHRSDEEPATPVADDPTIGLQAAEVLQHLAPEYRAALLMTKFEGRSLDEAAHRAGVSVTAMKSRVHRGIKQVRHLLAEEED
jgi:RNA polymerase sigma-70 factor (ECF subfamily)